MSKYIEFSGPGGTVIVESAEAGGSVMRGVVSSQLTEKVGRSLEDAMSVIRPLANATIASCHGMSALPETVEIEFGLKFDIKLGAVIAEAHTTGTLNVKLVWKPA
jgi:hypothetical protein